MFLILIFAQITYIYAGVDYLFKPVITVADYYCKQYILFLVPSHILTLFSFSVYCLSFYIKNSTHFSCANQTPQTSLFSV